MFFPEVNPVKDQVLGYFRRLADATGKITIEERDRLSSPALAQQYQVTEDGTILFVRGERAERIQMGADLARARTTLRALDRQVQGTVLRCSAGGAWST
jgi:fructosamine-3-kinase